MSIKSFDRDNLKTLREEMNKALETVAAKFDISIKVANATYNGTNATYKVELSCKNANGQTVTKEAACFKRMASLYGFNANDLGRVFKSHGEEFTIVGMNTRAHRFPILARKSSDGRVFKFASENVVNALKA